MLRLILIIIDQCVANSDDEIWRRGAVGLCQMDPQVSVPAANHHHCHGQTFALLVMMTNSLGTPETSLRGLSTLKVLKVERSIFAAPSSVFGSNIGRNLMVTIVSHL